MDNYNVDICSDHRFPSVCDFIGIFSAEGYNLLTNIPTRVTGNSSTCIDHIYVNTPLPNKSGVIKSSVSDNYAFFFFSLTNMNKELNSTEHIYFRDNSENSLNALKTHLSRSLISFNVFDNFNINNKLIFFNLIYDSYNTTWKIMKKKKLVRLGGKLVHG